MNLRHLLVLSLAFIFSSCSTYMTPMHRADMNLFTDPNMKQEFVARPAIHFPANVTVIHIQKPTERSFYARENETNAFSVVQKNDIENSKDLERVSKLPGVEQVVALNRLLLPTKLSSDLDLRKAAARLHADALLIYTVETEAETKAIFPLVALATLGLAPNWQYKASSTASGVLMDTNTGYIYATFEESESHTGITSGWLAASTTVTNQKAVEHAAFEKLLRSFELAWNRIYGKYGR